MIVYMYDPRTLKYIGEYKCQVNPLRKGAYIMPKHSTRDVPMGAGENEAIVFNKIIQSWERIVDLVGVRYYMPDGSTSIINKLGEELPENASLKYVEKTVSKDRKFYNNKQNVNRNFRKIIHDKKLLDNDEIINIIIDYFANGAVNDGDLMELKKRSKLFEEFKNAKAGE